MIKKYIIIASLSSLLFAGPSNDITISDLKEAVVLLIEDVKELKANNIAFSDSMVDYREELNIQLGTSIKSLRSEVRTLKEEINKLKIEKNNLSSNNNVINNTQIKTNLIGNTIQLFDTELDRKIRRFVKKYNR